jgi:pimeloyl-ACP methyl ester carboxylesterase
MGRIVKYAACAVASLLCSAAIGPCLIAGADEQPYEVVYSLAEAVSRSLTAPATPPPGVNVPCVPNAAHPNPVVLINGTHATMELNWAGLGPELANAGYCVFSAAIGGMKPDDRIQTCGPVLDTVDEVSALVDDVLKQTGAHRVDLVGHSQGGSVAEYYTKFFGQGKVGRVVGLAPPTHGCDMSNLINHDWLTPMLAYGCPALYDQTPKSRFIRNLNNGPIKASGVDYTIIETDRDIVVTPTPSAAFIEEPGVKNILLQDICPTDTSGHLTMAYSVNVWGLVRNALDPQNAVPPECSHP